MNDEKSQQKFWGYMLLLDCHNCSPTRISNKDYLTDWVKSLVARIGMVPFGEPQVVHFGHNERHLEGWTVIQLIETSNIIAHFNDHTGEGYIDIFSCRPFDIEEAVKQVEFWFMPEYIRKNYLTRQA